MQAVRGRGAARIAGVYASAAWPTPARTSPSTPPASRCAAWLYRPAAADARHGALRRHGARLQRHAPRRPGAVRRAVRRRRASACCCSTTAASATAAASRARSSTSAASRTTTARRSARRRASRGWTPRASRCSAPRSAAATSSPSPPRDAQIAAVIAQAPFADGVAQLRNTPPLTRARMTVDGAARRGRRRAGRPPVTRRRGRPARRLRRDDRPGGGAGLRGDRRRGLAWRNEVAARVMLTRRPAGARSGTRRSVGCPVLVCVCDDDATTPPGPAAADGAERAARRGRPLPDRALRHLHRRRRSSAPSATRSRSWSACCTRERGAGRGVVSSRRRRRRPASGIAAAQRHPSPRQASRPSRTGDERDRDAGDRVEPPRGPTRRWRPGRRGPRPPAPRRAGSAVPRRGWPASRGAGPGAPSRSRATGMTTSARAVIAMPSGRVLRPLAGHEPVDGLDERRRARGGRTTPRRP